MIRKLNLAACAAAIALVLLPEGSAGAQPVLPMKHSGKPTVPEITAGDAMTRLYIFADDSMMGRRAGTEGDRRGTAYIEREVRRMGLIPAGDNGMFFQAVPLYNRSFDTSSSLSADGVPLVAAQDYFPIRPGGTPRSVNGAQVIFAGSTADTVSLIPGAQAEGKVVIVTGQPAGIARRYPGAVAFILPRAQQQLGQIRNFVAGSSTLMKSDADTVTGTYTIVVPNESVQKFLGVPLENARPGTVGRTLRGEIRYRTEETPARNVVAIIPGSDPLLKGQYVALGAHSDHVGMRRQGPLDHDSLRVFNEIASRIYTARTGKLAGFPGSGITPDERATIRVNVDSLRRLRPARLDSIYNGADDDGSGSVGLLEIAEKYAAAKAKPRRSLLFVWHTGEESGLYGASWFTEHPTVPRDSIVAMMNIDMMGRGQAWDTPNGGPAHIQLIGTRRLSTELGNLIEEVNKAPRNSFRFDYQFDANGHPEQFYCRSDHFEYAKFGIPVAFVGTGGHIDYHQITDEPQYINYPHLAKVASFLGDVAERVANLDHRVVVDKPKPDPRGPCVQ